MAVEIPPQRPPEESCRTHAPRTGSRERAVMRIDFDGGDGRDFSARARAMKHLTTDEEAARLLARFEEAGINKAAFAREFGVPGGGSMIYQHTRGLKPISREAAIAYARGFGCAVADISTRIDAEIRQEAAALSRSDNSAEPRTGLSLVGQSVQDRNAVPFKEHDILQSAAGGAEYVKLEAYASRPGHPAPPPEIVAQLSALKAWALDNLGSADPNAIKLITCRGDSMHPTIGDGSLLFVDVRVTKYCGDGVYALPWNGGVIVRRLVARRNGSLEILADNRAGPSPEVVAADELDDLEIAGRVVRWWSLARA